MRAPSDYIHQTNLQLDLWGDTFASLERKAAKSAAEGRSSIEPRLRKLRRKKRVLKLRLLEAAHGTSKLDWESVRDELEAALGDFRQLATEVYDDVQKA